jgi:hypothetical protein
VALGDDQWSNLVSEVTRSELGSNFLVGENEGIVIDISRELNELFGLNNLKGVFVHVVAIIV